MFHSVALMLALAVEPCDALSPDNLERPALAGVWELEYMEIGGVPKISHLGTARIQFSATVYLSGLKDAERPPWELNYRLIPATSVYRFHADYSGENENIRELCGKHGVTGLIRIREQKLQMVYEVGTGVYPKDFVPDRGSAQRYNVYGKVNATSIRE